MEPEDRSAHTPIIRRARISDIAAVMRLAEITPTVAIWSRAMYATYCGAERQQDGISSVTALFVACGPRVQVVGFAAFSAVTIVDNSECELGNMVVAEEWRRQGVGRRLLEAGSLWGRTWRSAWEPSDEDDFRPKKEERPELTFWLEVRASNRSAIVFYESNGFRIAGRRSGYYVQPTEDAVLMAGALRTSQEPVEIFPLPGS